jgi:hypothetical protein
MEKDFSTVVNLLAKKRNILEITDRGDLRLSLTNFKPNIENLLSKHQASLKINFFNTNLDFFSMLLYLICIFYRFNY